jgi:guanylate kinase
MIISLSGPSGIGKGFIKRQLLEIYPQIRELAWFTTRSLRPKEQDGNRIHVSVAEFDEMVSRGELILVQHLFGHSYGLRKQDLLPSPDTRLTELHPYNLLDALKINPAIIAIGLVTSDLSLLRKRLYVVRQTESPAEIEKRMAVVEDEIRIIHEHRTLFASVIEITEDRESLVLGSICAVLETILARKEVE